MPAMESTTVPGPETDDDLALDFLPLQTTIPIGMHDRTIEEKDFAGPGCTGGRLDAAGPTGKGHDKTDFAESRTGRDAPAVADQFIFVRYLNRSRCWGALQCGLCRFVRSCFAKGTSDLQG